jgi:hypothetical protein
MSLKNFIIRNNAVVKTKGFVQKSMDLQQKDKKLTSLDEVKNLSKEFDKEAQKHGGKYIILGRNYKGIFTLRDQDGTYYDSDNDYYDSHGYDKDKFDKFYRLKVVLIK